MEVPGPSSLAVTGTDVWVAPAVWGKRGFSGFAGSVEWVLDFSLNFKKLQEPQILWD